ncbi:MAG: hypothetical protein HYV51_02155 [Parcubacteria group bacterium]|nr:hypothetical protein [Parcubacteria group bacterium]
MSDALTDIARDEQRGALFEKFLITVKNYIESVSQDTFTAAIKAAEAVDEVRGGYWGGKTNLKKSAENYLTKLTAKDETIRKSEWAKFLFEIRDSYYFRALKKISPFADCLLINIDYGYGFVTIRGLGGFFDKLIREAGMQTYDCDKYLIVMPEIKVNTSEVYWVDCGVSGVNGPRKPS